MNESERIVDQLKRAYEGPAWSGPSIKDVLEGIHAAKAAAHPVNGGHSIWELALHIAVWESVALRRIDGDPAQPHGCGRLAKRIRYQRYRMERSPQFNQCGESQA